MLMLLTASRGAVLTVVPLHTTGVTNVVLGRLAVRGVAAGGRCVDVVTYTLVTHIHTSATLSTPTTTAGPLPIVGDIAVLTRHIPASEGLPVAIGAHTMASVVSEAATTCTATTGGTRARIINDEAPPVIDR